MATRITFWDRLKLAAPLYAIFALATGVLDAFVNSETLNYLIFHSITFHLILFAVFLIIGPFFAKAIGLKFTRTRSADEGV